MKLPFIDIHIVRGRNVVTDEKLVEQEKTKKLRDKTVSNLLDKIDHLKGLLKERR
jgi:hypothetical protein